MLKIREISKFQCKLRVLQVWEGSTAHNFNWKFKENQPSLKYFTMIPIEFQETLDKQKSLAAFMHNKTPFKYLPAII